jgi:nicotinate-nucleotide pyrophosphorylase (carboxylating)
MRRKIAEQGGPRCGVFFPGGYFQAGRYSGIHLFSNIFIHRSDIDREEDLQYHRVYNKNGAIVPMDKPKNEEGKITRQLIELALMEDRVNEDVTTLSLLDCDRTVSAHVTAKQDGVISGVDVFTHTFKAVDPGVDVIAIKTDGSSVKKGEIVLTVTGKESSILKAERTALNFLQRLSGIATLSKQFAGRLALYKITLLDTRKTTPGMRLLEKKAVKDGGGGNHRMDLHEMAMVKDNHIKMAGTITNAVNKIKQKFPGKKIEVEVQNLEQLEEALALDIDMIMLDNFNPALLAEAVQRRNRHAAGAGIKLEVSGSVSLENIEQKAAAAAGVDFISVGALTHSFKSMDLSLNIEEVTDES